MESSDEKVCCVLLEAISFATVSRSTSRSNTWDTLSGSFLHLLDWILFDYTLKDSTGMLSELGYNWSVDSFGIQLPYLLDSEEATCLQQQTLEETVTSQVTKSFRIKLIIGREAEKVICCLKDNLHASGQRYKLVPDKSSRISDREFLQCLWMRFRNNYKRRFMDTTWPWQGIPSCPSCLWSGYKRGWDKSYRNNHMLRISCLSLLATSDRISKTCKSCETNNTTCDVCCDSCSPSWFLRCNNYFTSKTAKEFIR